MRRRSALALAASGGLAAGIAAALWRSADPAGEEPEAAAPDLWKMVFDGLDGKPLAMTALRGRPLVVNFWATWCPPCVAEMPLLDVFAKARAGEGWGVLALALDQMPAVRKFLAGRDWALQVALAGSDGYGLVKRLGNPVASLPFTVVYAASGAVLQRKVGAVDASWLGQVARSF